jgi:hypothetical protein
VPPGDVAVGRGLRGGRHRGGPGGRGRPLGVEADGLVVVAAGAERERREHRQAGRSLGEGSRVQGATSTPGVAFRHGHLPCRARAPRAPPHEVTNQAPPLAPSNLFTANAPLTEALEREGGSWGRGQAEALGERWGSPEVQEWAVQANEHPPVLRTHDRYGNRIDEVEFHPAWHELMRLSSEAGVHALPWTSDEPGAHCRAHGPEPARRARSRRATAAR